MTAEIFTVPNRIDHCVYLDDGAPIRYNDVVNNVCHFLEAFVAHMPHYVKNDQRFRELLVELGRLEEQK
jgi:hypothetical protein